MKAFSFPVITTHNLLSLTYVVCINTQIFIWIDGYEDISDVGINLTLLKSLVQLLKYRLL